MARWVARVKREGEPGPEPARMIFGGGRERMSRAAVSRGAVVVALAAEEL